MNKFQNHALRLNISFFKVISLECFEKSKANKKLLPLTSLKNYEIIYVETTTPPPKPHLDRSPSHVRHTTSTSPNSPNAHNSNSNGTTNTQNQGNNNGHKSTTLGNTNSTSSTGNLGTGISATTTTFQPISHYQHSKSAMVDMMSSQQIKPKSDSTPIQQRNALSSSTYKKTAISDYLTPSKVTADLSKTTDFSKLKYAPVNVKARNQANLTSLALKPATVEGKTSFLNILHFLNVH
jgi:hypothetical protein